uniref:Uncharacterized protein n=1 Tax=Setaria digitata TaxID=48799 RepID=A0A915PUF8_9BILA
MWSTGDAEIDEHMENRREIRRVREISVDTEEDKREHGRYEDRDGKRNLRGIKVDAEDKWGEEGEAETEDMEDE